MATTMPKDVRARVLRFGAPPDEPRTLVLYDVEEDRRRVRAVKICQDFGLERIQYSAFLGRLNRNRREELCRRLEEELEGSVARVRVQPICEQDAQAGWIWDRFSAVSLDDRTRLAEAEDADPRIRPGGPTK